MENEEFEQAFVASALEKYWAQRYALWSRFDEGIVMDNEGWFSVTPEDIAIDIAEKCRCDTIIDAFCGVGGNSIQFAFTCEHVIAIDIDPVKLLCARNNAAVYGVEDRIEFILGDFTQLAATGRLKADVVFLSPPWGGPQYLYADTYDIAKMMQPDGVRLFRLASKITESIAYFVPRNVNLKQMKRLCRNSSDPDAFWVDYNSAKQKVKAITVYYGELAHAYEENELEGGDGPAENEDGPADDEHDARDDSVEED